MMRYFKKVFSIKATVDGGMFFNYLFIYFEIHNGVKQIKWKREIDHINLNEFLKAH